MKKFHYYFNESKIMGLNNKKTFNFKTGVFKRSLNRSQTPSENLRVGLKKKPKEKLAYFPSEFLFNTANNEIDKK